MTGPGGCLPSGCWSNKCRRTYMLGIGFQLYMLSSTFALSVSRWLLLVFQLNLKSFPCKWNTERIAHTLLFQVSVATCLAITTSPMIHCVLCFLSLVFYMLIHRSHNNRSLSFGLLCSHCSVHAISVPLLPGFQERLYFIELSIPLLYFCSGWTLFFRFPSFECSCSLMQSWS